MVKKEGGGPVCGAQESDRTPSTAFAQDEVCSRAVLLGSGCAEYQAPRPVPQPSAKTNACRDNLVRKPSRRKSRRTALLAAAVRSLPSALFQHPRLLSTIISRLSKLPELSRGPPVSVGTPLSGGRMTSLSKNARIPGLLYILASVVGVLRLMYI